MPITRSLFLLNLMLLPTCLAAAFIGLGLAPSLHNIAAIWPVSGVILAAFLSRGFWVWPGALAGSFAAHAFLLSEPWPIALVIALVATLGPALTALILLRVFRDAALSSVRSVVRFAAVASFVSATTCLVGMVAVALPPTGEEIAGQWLEWTLASCLAVLAITPPLVWLAAERRFPPLRKTEFFLIGALLLTLTAFCYSLSPPVGYPVLLVVMLIAVRQSQREVALAVLSVIALALWFSMHRDLLPIASTTPSNLRVLGFLVFLAAGALLLGALVAESREKDALLLRVKEDHLKQSETRFKGAFEGAAQGMAIVSLEGNYLQVNASLCQMLGYSEAELLSTNFQSSTHPDDLKQDMLLMRAFTSGEQSSAQFEKRFIHRSGKVVVALLSVSVVHGASGEPVSYVVQIMDITDRKQAEELWRFGLENAADVVWDWNIATDKIVFSGKTNEFFGRSDGDIPQDAGALRALVHPEDISETLKKVVSLLDTPGYAYAAEYRIRLPNDSYKWILSRGLVMSRDRDNKPIRAVGTMVDMTEIRGLQERLHQSDKMAALGQLSGGVAHDVNNDLGVIVGSAELILERAAPGSREEVLAARIVSTVRRSMDLVRRMLAFSRQAENMPEPLELAVFLSGFIDTLGRTLGAHIQTRLRVSNPLSGYWVNLDRNLLESSLINLSINARDAMSGGGVLSFSLAADGDNILLTVSDTGSGMSADVQRRIFEPFFTTKPAGGGTGLGLAMVYGFIQQSGGRIAVESKPGAGSRFVLQFPSAPAPQDATRAPAIPAIPETETYSVLLIDDNDVLRITMREQLARLGCTVQEAANFEQAVAVLSDTNREFDFILCDYDLGSGPDGIALANWSRANGRHIPGTIMSGYLKTLPKLPPGWTSLQKPIQSADLRAMLAALDKQAPVETTVSRSAILIVEDRDDMRFIAAEILKREGYAIAEAATAREALRVLGENSNIQLVLCDIGLPDMSGRLLAEQIRRLYPIVQVVLMSGTREASEAPPQKGERLLHKPFTRESLARFVADALSRSA